MLLFLSNTFLSETLLCIQITGHDKDNPTYPINHITFLQQLAIAQALKTPLQRRVKNQSVDRSKMSKVYREMDRESIRLNFYTFLRELWYNLVPVEREGGIVQKVVEVSNGGVSWEYAQDLVLNAFSRAVYEIIFCNWLCIDDKIFACNIKRSFALPTISISDSASCIKSREERSARRNANTQHEDEDEDEEDYPSSTNHQTLQLSFYAALFNARGKNKLNFFLIRIMKSI